ncbi:MAG: hypothetical protein ABFS10_02425 [Bacteroidota bacterium]
MKHIFLLFPSAVLISLMILGSCSQSTNEEKEDKQIQLSNLKSKQIMVAMWGWEPEIMAPAAVGFGYDVVNQPQNSDTVQHAIDIPIWQDAGLKMLVRPDLFDVVDPFNKGQVEDGYEKMKKVIQFHERNNPAALAYVIQWGLFGEGGFVWNYQFSDHAKEAFNEYMQTPGEPLPEGPPEGQPGSMRWIKWLEFRSAFLSDFRADYVKFAKQFTSKLVGTWSEVYPTEHYVLNMGDAPGADFMFYDLSFGDVTCNQRIAFGESHGEMEAFPDFESWLQYELPLMAKGAGEGVTPMAFQFPMREGHEVKNIGGRKQYTVKKIEDEYSLKLGPYIRELLDAAAHPMPESEVALVYQSFQASALPAGPFNELTANSVMPLYRVHSKAIEGALHQMGVHMRAIPYEWLATHDLSQYKLVILPDPMYLTPEMRSNLERAQRVLYSGELLMAHRDPESESGSYLTEFSAIVNDPVFGKIEYLKNEAGSIEANNGNPLMEGVNFSGDQVYPADQMFIMRDKPEIAEVLASVNELPVIFTLNGGKVLFVANRAFSHGWKMEEDWLENAMFMFLKNLLISSEVTIPVISPPQARANLSSKYGSYGLSGNIGWNTTAEAITIELESGTKTEIPAYGWTKID